MNLRLKVALLAALGLSAMTARADITFSTKNVGSLNDSNLLFNSTGDIISDSSADSDWFYQVVGHLNTTTAPPVTVQAKEAFNVDTGGGQATIQANDGGLTYLEFFLGPPPGGTYASIIFNLNAIDNGTVTIRATEGVNPTCPQGGCQTTSPPLTLGKNGSNFYTTLAVNGKNISDVSFTSSVDLSSVKQVRLGGEGLGTPIPEPSAIVLLGTVLSGLALWQKKRISARN